MAHEKSKNVIDSYDAMFQYFSKFIDIPVSSLELLYEKLEPFSCSRKEYIVIQGNVVTHLYFLLNGVQRTFFIQNRKEYVINLEMGPAFCCIGDSFLKQKPTQLNLQALSDSELLRIPKQELDELMKADASISRLMGRLVSKELRRLLKRHYELMSLPMKERFHLFAERNAHLLQEVPQKDIASYLNMDPTNFSKLINSTKIK